jgi:hypothetical protein
MRRSSVQEQPIECTDARFHHDKIHCLPDPLFRLSWNTPFRANSLVFLPSVVNIIATNIECSAHSQCTNRRTYSVIIEERVIRFVLQRRPKGLCSVRNNPIWLDACLQMLAQGLTLPGVNNWSGYSEGLTFHQGS